MRNQNFEHRSLQLARQNDLLGSAIYRGASAVCETVEIFSVRSVSAHSIYLNRHTVEHDLVTDTLRCDCKAGQRGYACGHAGSVADYLNRRAALLASAVCEAAEAFA